MTTLEFINAARVQVVDDEAANVQLLEQLLRRMGVHNVNATTDPRMMLADFAGFRPDLILLDLHMPHSDGYTILEHLQALIPAGTYLPILVLTADVTPEARQRALSLGAKDFLSKPFDLAEVTLRVTNLLETRNLYLRLQASNDALGSQVQQRTRQLNEAQVEILERMARAAEYRDDDTGEHTQRVGWLSAESAFALGLPGVEVGLLRLAAPLHDLGKIAISDAILLKPGRLTDEEWALMRTHSNYGAKLLGGGTSELVRMAETIAFSHHERWDGSGYPQGLAKAAIPLPARIVAVADVFDALTHERPYKQAWTVERALEELQIQKGRHFDPAVVDVMTGVVLRRAAQPVMNRPARMSPLRQRSGA